MHAWSATVLADLSWPLDGLAAADARARVPASRSRAQFDNDRRWRAADAWRRREAARDEDNDDDARLDAEEAQAELDAIQGVEP
jgi:hypothetical protein